MSKMNRGFSARELVHIMKLGHSCEAQLSVGTFLNKLDPNGPLLLPLRKGASEFCAIAYATLRRTNIHQKLKGNHMAVESSSPHFTQKIDFI